MDFRKGWRYSDILPAAGPWLGPGEGRDQQGAAISGSCLSDDEQVEGRESVVINLDTPYGQITYRQAA